MRKEPYIGKWGYERNGLRPRQAGSTYRDVWSPGGCQRGVRIEAGAHVSEGLAKGSEANGLLASERFFRRELVPIQSILSKLSNLAGRGG